MSETKKWNGSKPVNCQLCNEHFDKIFIDGRTRAGQWALLCEVCHWQVGIGLGTGRGQKYNLETLEKMEG